MFGIITEHGQKLHVFDHNKYEPTCLHYRLLVSRGIVFKMEHLSVPEPIRIWKIFRNDPKNSWLLFDWRVTVTSIYLARDGDSSTIEKNLNPLLQSRIAMLYSSTVHCFSALNYLKSTYA